MCHTKFGKVALTLRTQRTTFFRCENGQKIGPLQGIAATSNNKLYTAFVGMGPSWPSIEHGHSGITAHLETAAYNVLRDVEPRCIVSDSNYTGRNLPSRV